MTNSSPRIRRGSLEWQLMTRAAGYLIARAGRLPMDKCRRLALQVGFEGSLPRRPDGRNRGSYAGAAAYRVSRALGPDGLGLVRREPDGGGVLVAEDLLHVVAWLSYEMHREHEFRQAQIWKAAQVAG